MQLGFTTDPLFHIFDRKVHQKSFSRTFFKEKNIIFDYLWGFIKEISRNSLSKQIELEALLADIIDLMTIIVIPYMLPPN